MIGKLLLEEITRESIDSGEIVTERDGNITAISTDKGTLGIREDGDNQFCVSYLPKDLIVKDGVFDGNERMKEWYEDFLKSRRDEKDYVQIALFSQTLNFGDAYELSEYILSKIIEKKHRAHMNLN